MRKLAVNTNKIITSKGHMLCAFADGVDIIGRTIKEASSVFSKIKKESAKVCLAVNEDKTLLMVSTSRASTRLDQRIHVGRPNNFEVVDAFTYLRSAVNKLNVTLYWVSTPEIQPSLE